MKPATILLIVAGGLSMLSGCKEDQAAEAVQTAEWYKTHDPEREAMLSKCKSNPGQLAATPNCINASQAQQSLVWGSRSGIKVAPLTADDLKNK